MAKRRPSGDGMVRKREDGRWEGRIVVGHKEDGDPIFQYVLAPTQKALLSKLHQNIETFRDVELCGDSRMTLAQWLDRWLDEYAASRLRESTMGSYRMYAEQYIKPRLGNKKINSITPADIQRMQGSYGRVDMGAIMASLVMAIIPIVVFYLSCQKHIIKGVAAGAVKG